MPARKKTVHGRTRNRRSAPLERSWNEARRALRSAEASVGRRVAALMQRSGLEPRKLKREAEKWRARLERERRSAGRRVAAGLDELKQRAWRDRRRLAHGVDQAMARALAALNIPSRHEVQLLSRRVGQLTQRVEGRRR
jgi:hypothetical protein